MFFVLLKSLDYKNNKVYIEYSTDMVNSNYKGEHIGLTRLYNKLGKEDFEKWFVINCLTKDKIIVVDECNSNLKRLNNMYLSLLRSKSNDELHEINDLVLKKSIKNNKNNKLYDKLIISDR